MSRDPFTPQTPPLQRTALAIALSGAGFVSGLFATRQLDQPWPIAIVAGLGGGALFAFFAWRSPETFFKNRP